MSIRKLTSRRTVLALAAGIGASVLFGGAAEAAKRAPEITGQWSGVLIAEGFDPTPYSLNITDQKKKTGKFSGQASFPKQKPVNFKGKIQPNRKVKGKFNGDINGEPIVFTLKVKVSSDAQSAEGTFTGKDEDGNVVVSGTTTLEKVPDDV